MTKPTLIIGVAAFVLSVLPLAASAGAAYSGHKWQRAHDGQGVMRVYNGDAYRAPETYIGGEFRGGLDVQTAHDDQDEYYETSDRYASAPVAAPCRSVCVTAYAPPPPPPCVRQDYREVRHAGPRVVSRQVVIQEDERREEHREYYRASSHDEGYRRHHVRHDDCPCREAGHDHPAYDDDRYDDRYDDRSRDGHDEDRRDDRYGRDVFGRY